MRSPIEHIMAESLTGAAALPRGGRGFWAGLGRAMQRRRRLIQAIQWCVVAFYLFLVVVPAFLPLPGADAHLWDNLRLFAQFAFWGIWWPFVMVATMLFGRVWCGVFCPEGALTEWASRRGLGRPLPRWLKWGGWPFVAFVATTVYGQLVSVYEYPQAALLVLGGSTVAAIAVGFVYGRGKRIWCRHLCPASGVFALLAKVSPLHFRVDRAAWDRATIPLHPVDCAPLVDVRRMTGAGECHACGRCAGHREAVELALRAPGEEIVAAPRRAGSAEALTLIFGVIGVATAAFQWSASPWFVAVKTAVAEWLVDHDAFLLLQDNAPWWLLTHYPEANDVFTWLDGLCVLGYILGGGGLLGLFVLAALRLSARLAGSGGPGWQRLALGLVPMAGIGVFLGLSMLTLGHLKAERLVLDWVPAVRVALLATGLLFSARLGWRLLDGADLGRRILAWLAYALPLAAIGGAWTTVFFIW